MSQAELVGILLAVAGVLALAAAAGMWLGVSAGLAVIGVAAVFAGVQVIRAAAANEVTT